MPQEAADARADAWQTQLQCLLAVASLQLPPPPPVPTQQDTDPNQPAAGPAIAIQPSIATRALPADPNGPAAAQRKHRPTAPLPALTKDNYAAVTALSKGLAQHTPEWLKQLQGSQQMLGFCKVLTKLQWQLAGLVEQLYSLLVPIAAAHSPSHISLNIKVIVLKACSVASVVCYNFMHSVRPKLLKPA